MSDRLSDSSADSSALAVAGDQATLAHRYGGALYALAEQAGAVDGVAADLRSLRRVWDESSEWRQIATDPRLSEVLVAGAVEEIVKHCDFGKLTANFLALTAQNRRLGLLPAIIARFFDEVAARRGEYNAEIHTARALSPAQRERLTAALNAAAGGKVHLTITEDASLLGGMTVKLGSKFIDASVKNRLDHLERTLIAGAVA